MERERETTKKGGKKRGKERGREGGKTVGNVFGLQICRGEISAKFNRILFLETSNPQPPSSTPDSDGRV